MSEIPTTQDALVAWRKFMAQPPAGRQIRFAREGGIISDRWVSQRDFASFLPVAILMRDKP